MTTPSGAAHVALLRAVNVGGKSKLPMKDLAAIFADAGASDVSTYIQSGNVVFRAPSEQAAPLATAVQSAIEAKFGFRPPILLRDLDGMRAAVAGNPFLTREGGPETLHLYFLDAVPDPARIADLDPGRSAPDAFSVIGRHIYLHLPGGMGRTKLTNAWFESKLGVASTARNWRTTLALLERAEAL